MLSDHELQMMQQNNFTPAEIEELEIEFMQEEAI